LIEQVWLLPAAMTCHQQIVDYVGVITGWPWDSWNVICSVAEMHLGA